MADILYNHQAIEKKWQTYWSKNNTFKPEENSEKPPFYCLEMFPYPSGKIHMGHVRNYTLGDVISRYKKMRGFNVLHPIGWDAFGLPAENAAIERNIHPSQWTKDNIQYMREQLQRLGISYDWSREINTSLPDYYRWNQWFFIKMFEKKLAYKKHSAVNWCPSCETVLANEQVIVKETSNVGLCWRCDSVVAQKELDQWFFKITDYAEELLQGCDHLPGWPERVLTMQRNWIGKSIGAEIEFPIADHAESIRVFTTRPDTLFGATFISLAPDHPLVETLIKEKSQEQSDKDFVQNMRAQKKNLKVGEEFEKEGIFTGSYATHPLTKNPIPIWVANFVLMDYGTGAVMAVPAHDQRDFEFAKKYGLSIHVVIQNPEGSLSEDTLREAYTDEIGTLQQSGDFSGLSPKEAQNQITLNLEKEHLGKQTIQYRLRDWGISRQRYWGAPIPIIYCKECGTVPVPYSDLPVRLPPKPPLTGKGKSPLSEDPAFIQTVCPKCHQEARRETDTMDTFVDSSWYFLRYLSPDLDTHPFDSQQADHWMPVHQYIGGIEHAVLHLLYSRFFTKVIRDLGLLKTDEPFANILTQGMVVKESHYCKQHGYLFPNEVQSNKLCSQCQGPLIIGRIEKMSKSKKNVIEPDKLLEKYGADTSRLFSLFAAPPEKDLEWNNQGVEGSFRFLQRVHRLVHQFISWEGSKFDGSVKSIKDFPSLPAERGLYRKTHQTIKKVTEDIEKDFHFNTAIAALMELTNSISQYISKKKDHQEEMDLELLGHSIELLVILLTPFSPHLSEELWEKLGHSSSINQEKWPIHHPEALKEEMLTIVIQVNGKLRSKILISPQIAEKEIKETALKNSKTVEFLKGKTIKKVIYVPKRLVNIVI